MLNKYLEVYSPEHIYQNKRERSQINNISFNFKKQEK